VDGFKELVQVADGMVLGEASDLYRPRLDLVVSSVNKLGISVPSIRGNGRIFLHVCDDLLIHWAKMGVVVVISSLCGIFRSLKEHPGVSAASLAGVAIRG
jgi:hypothetical protein